MRKVLEASLCKINYSDSLEDLVQSTIPLLDKKIIEYSTFFGINIQKKSNNPALKDTGYDKRAESPLKNIENNLYSTLKISSTELSS